jgi:hypothetical protein
LPLPLFLRPGSDPGRADVGAIDKPKMRVNFSLFVQADLQGFEDSIEGAVVTIAVEAVVDAFPFTVAFRQIAPRRASAKNPDHAVESSAMVVPSPATALFGKKAFDEIPLRFLKIVSCHVCPP